MFYELENKKNRIIRNSPPLFTQRRHGEKNVNVDGVKQGKTIISLVDEEKTFKGVWT